MSQAEPKHSAEEAVRTAEEQARRAEAEAERFASEVRDRAESRVRDAGRLAHDEANARVSGAFDAAAGQAERAASAAEDAASNYQSGAAPARALKSVSDLLEDTARGLRDSDLDDVVGNLGRAARRNPVTFLAGAAAVGFVAARLARASDSHAGDHEPPRWPARGSQGEGAGTGGTSAVETPATSASATSSGANPVPGAAGTSQVQARPSAGDGASAQTEETQR